MRIFTGVWPALVTPSHEDNSVNVPVLRSLVNYLIDKRVDGFYVGGTTGEGIFMPVEQRKRLVETVLSEVDGQVPVIVHAGSMVLNDAVDLARHARDHGADGISSIIPPLYNSLESTVKYYETLAAATPQLPLVAYLLNPDFDAAALVSHLMHIPNLGGIKYTGANMYEFQQMVTLGGGKWSMFSGMDEQCVYAAMAGATGNIGSTVNIMPGIYHAIQSHIKAGKYAEAHDLQTRANKVTTIMIDTGFHSALRVVLSGLLGQDVGNVRLPRLSLPADKRETLYQQLADVDFEAISHL